MSGQWSVRSVLSQPVFFAVRWKLLRLREHRRPERGLPLSSIPDTVVKMKEPWKVLSRRRKWPWLPPWQCMKNYWNMIMWMSTWPIRKMSIFLWQTGHSSLKSGMRIFYSVFITMHPWIMTCSVPKYGSLPYSHTMPTAINSAGNRCSRWKIWDCSSAASRQN